MFQVSHATMQCITQSLWPPSEDQVTLAQLELCLQAQVGVLYVLVQLSTVADDPLAQGQWYGDKCVGTERYIRVQCMHCMLS